MFSLFPFGLYLNFYFTIDIIVLQKKLRLKKFLQQDTVMKKYEHERNNYESIHLFILFITFLSIFPFLFFIFLSLYYKEFSGNVKINHLILLII